MAFKYVAFFVCLIEQLYRFPSALLLQWPLFNKSNPWTTIKLLRFSVMPLFLLPKPKSNGEEQILLIFFSDPLKFWATKMTRGTEHFPIKTGKAAGVIQHGEEKTLRSLTAAFQSLKGSYKDLQSIIFLYFYIFCYFKSITDKLLFLILKEQWISIWSYSLSVNITKLPCSVLFQKYLVISAASLF